MLKIGLTGGIGSGKSTVAKFFAELGIEIIDADSIVHELLVPNTPTYQKIIEHFGERIVAKDHMLDRKLLRQLIFNDINEREWLEDLLHPIIFQIMLKRADLAKSPYCVLVIPLLFETNASFIVDRVLVVASSEADQLGRSSKRDQSDIHEIKKIILSQIDGETRLKQADDVIYNNGSLQELKDQVLKLHQQYLKYLVKKKL